MAQDAINVDLGVEVVEDSEEDLEVVEEGLEVVDIRWGDNKEKFRS